MTLPNAEKLVETLKNKINEIIDDKTVLIGVQRGGELILQKILPGLKNTVATGSIDTSFYRDDFSSRGLKVKNKPSKIDTEINDKHIILIDERYTSIEASHEIKDKKIDLKKKKLLIDQIAAKIILQSYLDQI